MKAREPEKEGGKREQGEDKDRGRETKGGKEYSDSRETVPENKVSFFTRSSPI